MKGHMGMVEDGANCNAKRGLTSVATVTMLERLGIGGGAVGAGYLIAPTGLFQMFDAICLDWKPLANCYNVHAFRPS
jgi:hypothetical protein